MPRLVEIVIGSGKGRVFGHGDMLEFLEIVDGKPRLLATLRADFDAVKGQGRRCMLIPIDDAEDSGQNESAA